VSYSLQAHAKTLLHYRREDDVCTLSPLARVDCLKACNLGHVGSVLSFERHARGTGAPPLNLRGAEPHASSSLYLTPEAELFDPRADPTALLKGSRVIPFSHSGGLEYSLHYIIHPKPHPRPSEANGIRPMGRVSRWRH